ncbi:MAG TPA: hypothetical protein VIE15_02250, partial [Acidimicrobiales bacterium]
MPARLAVPAETRQGETRVSLTPDGAKRLVVDGFEVVVQHDAGAMATFTDEQYADGGATIAASAEEACLGASIVVRVNAPTLDEASILDERAIHLSFLQPAQS